MTNNIEKDLNKITIAYDSPTWWYDIRGFFILTFAYRSTLWEQIALFSRNMGPIHLEGAIGTGTLFGLILRWRQVRGQPRVAIIGFDYVASMLAGAQRRFRRHKNIQLIQADVGHLPFQDQTFDTVNIANSMHCFSEIDLAFAEIYRVLKPGGTWAFNILLEPRTNGVFDRLAKWINRWGQRKGILYRTYTVPQVEDLVSRYGFEIVFRLMRGNVLNLIVTRTSG